MEEFTSFAKGFGSVFGGLKDFFNETVHDVEARVQDSLFAFKRMVFRSMIEFIMITFSVAFVLVGGVMFISRYLALDIVLLVVGLLLLNGVLLFGKFSRK